MRAVPARAVTIRWLLATLIAVSLVAFAVPEPAQAQVPPPPPPECTWSPDTPFHDACVAHDYCYSPASFLSRRECDDNFRWDMHYICRTDPMAIILTPPGGCHPLAEVYYWSVRWGGEDHYDGRGGDGYGDDDDDEPPPYPPPPPGG